MIVSNYCPSVADADMESIGLRILLIDDDELWYTMANDFLSKTARFAFDLEWIGTYDAALETMRRNQHDVYLLDYNLGEHNGLELLREAIEKGCKAPIIMLTGQGDPEVDIQAMKAGAVDYLNKREIRTPLFERSIRYAVEQQRSKRRVELLADLVENASHVMIFILSQDGRIMQCNALARNTFGYSKNEMLPHSLGSLLRIK